MESLSLHCCWIGFGLLPFCQSLLTVDWFCHQLSFKYCWHFWSFVVCFFFHSWCFLPLLKLWKPRSIENGAAAISESLESAFVSMQRCTKRFIAQRKTDSFPAKRSEKRETPFPDNLLGRKTEFPKFRHYRQFYRTSCEERIKWSQNSIKRLDCKKKIGLFWKEHGNMSPPDPCYYMAQPITGEIGDGGRGKCVLGEHVIRSSDPSICFQLCSKNKKR